MVINLSPTEQKKKSPIFDLAIAIGVMKEAVFLGVLSLDDTIKLVEGMLPAILADSH